jgi:hypothetical protein
MIPKHHQELVPEPSRLGHCEGSSYAFEYFRRVVFLTVIEQSIEDLRIGCRGIYKVPDRACPAKPSLVKCFNQWTLSRLRGPLDGISLFLLLPALLAKLWIKTEFRRKFSSSLSFSWLHRGGRNGMIRTSPLLCLCAWESGPDGIV